MGVLDRERRPVARRPRRRARARSIHFGGLGSHVVLGSDGTIYVARFDTGGSGEHLLVIEPESGTIGGVRTGPLGALTVGDEESLLALEKADRLLRVDPVTRAIVGEVSVDVNDEHMEVLAAAGPPGWRVTTRRFGESRSRPSR